jgi:hypothetical protein
MACIPVEIRISNVVNAEKAASLSPWRELLALADG